MFAERLKHLREKAQISVIELAERSGLERTAIHRLEAGDRQPSWETVWKLAEAIGVTPNDFLPSDDGGKSPKKSKK